MVEKVKSKREYDEVFESLVRMTIHAAGVERKQAELRVRNLLDSGALDSFKGPDDPGFQRTVNMFMSIPVDESTGDYKADQRTGSMFITDEDVALANAELYAAVRRTFKALSIPLNTKFETRLPNKEDLDKPVIREVWIKQLFPIKRTVKLLTQKLEIVIDSSGPLFTQDITVELTA